MKNDGENIKKIVSALHKLETNLNFHALCSILLITAFSLPELFLQMEQKHITQYNPFTPQS